jgi:hypothetical protein
LRQGKGLDGEAVMAELLAELDPPSPARCLPRYVLSPEARGDLSEIRDYLASQDSRLAWYVLQEIMAAFRWQTTPRPGTLAET